MSSWATEDSDALAPCGHCDNCTRPADGLTRRDVTFEAWQVLKVADAVQHAGGQLTLTMLADLARGNGGGSYGVGGGGRKGKGKAREKEKADMDLEAVCGGKVNLKKDVGTLPLFAGTLLTKRFPGGRESSGRTPRAEISGREVSFDGVHDGGIFDDWSACDASHPHTSRPRQDTQRPEDRVLIPSSYSKNPRQGESNLEQGR